MSASGCTHLNALKLAQGTTCFKIIHTCFISCLTKDCRKLKVHNCFCYVCHSKRHRLHACLSCYFFGCYVHQHIQDHAKKTHHYIAVDLTYGALYCSECSDYVYDKEFDTISREQKKLAAQRLGIKLYFPWEPSDKELQVLKANPLRKAIVQNSYIGLRGLVNLGETCFMNCIVQVLIHTPLLRDFFLADAHICNVKMSNMCSVCIMSKLFQQFYSGEITPCIPHELLYLIWTQAPHLSGYEPQDAHECFIATLGVLQKHWKDPTENSNYTCIIDKIFIGELQSDVVCQNCKFVSTTIDPFSDISLDIGLNSNNNSGRSNRTTKEIKVTSLYDCLKMFTQLEQLEANQKCSTCQYEGVLTKQLTIKKIPIVACFHLKRLENPFKKNQAYISFPECIDLTPYMSSYYGQTPSSGTKYDNFKIINNKYSLFAVVTHLSSKTHNGHYISYIRHYRNQWFECSDDAIKVVNVEDVLKSEGYLLFYHKQILEYE